MYNNVLISLAVSTVPVLAFLFVGFLLLHKLYVKVRSRFAVTVNCWFCNQNTRVPYLESNSWTCPYCEQYNGFTKDGDYNREILQQLDCSNLYRGVDRQDKSFSEQDTSFSALSAFKNNGFCHECNEAQRLKVEKLAQFEPKNESRFNEELNAYKVKLEEQYRLCATCDRHLRKVLHEKKKMVLGSKFLDFIINGAEKLKQPHFQHIRHVQRQHWKRRLSLHITILTIVNLFSLCYILQPTVTREQCAAMLGKRLGEHLFFAGSHVLALCRVLTTYIWQICGSYPFVEKCKLFARTIFLMLMYSLGLKLPQVTRINFSSLYVLAYPFALLGMCFGYKLVDGFKLTRFTFLLALWSTFSGGLIEEKLYFSSNILLLFASVLTLLLTATNNVEISPQLQDNSANSFHKIYSEDYLSDDETISMLSQRVNCSDAASNIQSNSLLHEEFSPLHKSTLYKSPVTSSTFSLNKKQPRSQFSPNSSFSNAPYSDLKSHNNSIHLEYAASAFGDFTRPAQAVPLSACSPFFGSNLELNSHQRSKSTLFGQSGNYHGGADSANTSLLHTSFNGQSHTHPHLSHKRNEAFAHYRPGNFSMQREHFPVQTATLHSPFSLSSNAVYPQQRPASRTNLLTPSRFSTTCLTRSNASATSWLSAGSLNQSNSIFPAPRQTAMMTAINETQSRASSQSSGFESQNDRVNVSRENSLTTENIDAFQQKTKPFENMTFTFQPIDTSGGVDRDKDVLARPSSLSTNPALVVPLTVNCGGQALSDLWGLSIHQRRSVNSSDSFNLRKINEELPRNGYNKYKRGDLLKKWKESQMIS